MARLRAGLFFIQALNEQQIARLEQA